MIHEGASQRYMAKSQLYQMTTMAAAGSLVAEGLGVRHKQKNGQPSLLTDPT